MQVGQVVRVLDMGIALGVIETASDGVFGVRGLDGSLWAREADELSLADSAATAQFVRDVFYLVNAHPELKRAHELVRNSGEALRERLAIIGETSNGQVVCWLERHGRAGNRGLTVAYAADWTEALAEDRDRSEALRLRQMIAWLEGRHGLGAGRLHGLGADDIADARDADWEAAIALDLLRVL